MSTFSGLSVALSSLQAQRRVMDVIAQNTANVNTPGYTRQRAELQAIDPAQANNIWGMQLRPGDGVTVSNISRISDDVTLGRVRGHEADSGYLSTMSTTLAGVEKDFNEPSDTGLTEQLGDFTAAMNDAANAGSTVGSDQAAAVGVGIQKAVAVTDTIRAGYENLNDRFDGLRKRVDTTLDDVNSTLKSIAALNKEIFSATVGGSSTNELQDQRDQLLTKLSSIAGVDIAQADSPQLSPEMVKVSIGGVTVVNGLKMAGTLTATGGTTMGSTIGVSLTAPDGTTTALDASTVGISGSLGADLEALNKTLPGIGAGYDAVAAKLTAVMADNGNPGFFTGTAKDLKVAITDPVAVNVSTPGTKDGRIADSIVVAMRNAATSPDTDWKKLVGDTGTAAASFATRAKASESNRLAAQSALTSTTGVDIDEEMTNLVSTQRAYEAAGKLLATIDSMLDTLINRTGR